MLPSSVFVLVLHFCGLVVCGGVHNHEPTLFIDFLFSLTVPSLGIWFSITVLERFPAAISVSTDRFSLLFSTELELNLTL